MTKEPVCGTGEALSRRTMLAALPAAALGSFGTAALASEEITPVQKRFHDWLNFYNWLNDLPDDTPRDEFTSYIDTLYETEEEILRMPTTCLGDFISKLLVNTRFFEPVDEFEAILGKEALRFINLPPDLLARL